MEVGESEEQWLMGLRKVLWRRHLEVSGPMLKGSLQEEVDVYGVVCAVAELKYGYGAQQKITHDGILELQVLLPPIRRRLVLLRLLGSPDSVSLFPKLIL